MGIAFKVYKDGEEYISLTEHSIKNVIFDAEKETDLKPRLHTITKSLALEGFLNTDLVDEAPRPILDEYGEQVVDENEEPQFHLREIDSVRQLANWSIIPEYCDCYCDVTVAINDASGELVKEESFECMFVVDYKETFDIDHGNGLFNILIREREIVEVV